METRASETQDGRSRFVIDGFADMGIVEVILTNGKVEVGMYDGRGIARLRIDLDSWIDLSTWLEIMREQGKLGA